MSLGISALRRRMSVTVCKKVNHWLIRHYVILLSCDHILFDWPAALETEKVTVSIAKRLGAEDTQQVSWPLKGTVWACADQQQRRKSFDRADMEIVKAHSVQVRPGQLLEL